MAKIEVKGLEPLTKEYQELIKRLSDMTVPLEIIGEDILLDISNSFDKAQSPEGTPWKGLSETTAKERLGKKGRKLGKKSKARGETRRGLKNLGKGLNLLGQVASMKPLSDTRRLVQSIKKKVTKKSVTVGTNVIYGPTHQFGNPDNLMYGSSKAPIPARPFLPLDAGGNPSFPKDKESRYLNILSEYLFKGLKK